MHRIESKNNYDTIELVDGDVHRFVYATYKGDTEVVYRQDSNGDTFCKHLYQNAFGLYFSIGGEVITHSAYNWYCGQIESCYGWNDGWFSCNPMHNFNSKKINQNDRDLIASVYPGFKYVMNKWHGTREKTIKALQLWKEYPQIEFLLAGNFENVAFSKTFYRLSDKKKKEVINFLKSSKKDWCISEVQTILKYKITEKEYIEYCRNKHVGYSLVLSFPEYQYLKSHNLYDKNCINNAEIYRDYKKMLKQSNHNEKDPYWLFPADLDKAHAKLIQEQEAIKMALNAQIAMKYYTKAKRFKNFAKEINGFSVYIPQTLDEWDLQATKLHQCIKACKYYEKINPESYVIVFIQRDHEPVATAEIKMANGEIKIGQFYGDEIDRNNCKPSEEVAEALNLWLKDFSFKRKKKEKIA